MWFIINRISFLSQLVRFFSRIARTPTRTQTKLSQLYVNQLRVSLLRLAIHKASIREHFSICEYFHYPYKEKKHTVELKPVSITCVACNGYIYVVIENDCFALLSFCGASCRVIIHIVCLVALNIAMYSVTVTHWNCDRYATADNEFYFFDIFISSSISCLLFRFPFIIII